MSEVHTYMEFLSALDDHPLALREGETLFAEGEASDGRMFVVRTGSVTLRSGRKVLERVGPGGVLGELALIDPAPRSAAAVAGPDCTISPISELQMRRLVTHVPGFALELMRVVVRRFRQATGVQQAARKPAAGRSRSAVTRPTKKKAPAKSKAGRGRARRGKR